MKNPWKKIKSRIVHKNPWYWVREDDVIGPDGKKGKYYVIEGLNSVAVIAQDKDEKIYLVGQSRYPTGNNYSWEIITGGFKKGDKPVQKARQELEEEAGIGARKWTGLGYFNPINGYCSERTYVFLAQDLISSKQKLEGTKDITVKKVSLKEILEMIHKNKIVCGITIAAINKFLLYANKL